MPVLSSVPKYFDWAGAKAALRDPKCCVVSISGLESHLQVLQAQWATEPNDVDLRMRVCSSTHDQTHDDCIRVLRSISPSLLGESDKSSHETSPCTTALEELAAGFGLLADGPLEDSCRAVFMRVVCASDYQAREPMFHTDKAPLRGYVTLRGLGTEFMMRPCSPAEYVTLRGLGVDTLSSLQQSVRQAEELEFIVMKGDYYEAPPTTNDGVSFIGSMAAGLWQRSYACVHRSPNSEMQRRRVILSLDLADGDDDREWHVADLKKKWRSGMTQRKGTLVV